uniref:Transposase n=1 Tax=Syphacia muris TaxID=451379 RepID=A0A158R501_9BILA
MDTGEFQVYFQKNFDDEFYEFPLDATITSSREHFLAFCHMTNHKVVCFKKRCGTHRHRIPWSTDIHLCHYHKRQFLNSLRCFKLVSHFLSPLTAVGAHHTCNRYCSELSGHYSLKPDEKRYLASLKLTRIGNATYLDLSIKCYFQMCQYECRRGLMKQLCEGAEKVTAMDALFDYYAHDQLDQYQAFANQHQQFMMPLMCRTLLPKRYKVKDRASKVVQYEAELLKQVANNAFYQLSGSRSFNADVF